MKRFWPLAVPLVMLMIVVMVPSGRSERLAADPDAPWNVEHTERFLPPDWSTGVIQSVSPHGAWIYGHDDMNVEQPTCYWEASTWERTCPELEPGEAISFTRASAWSPDDAALVTSTHLLTDEHRYVERLVRIELASGEVTELYRPASGTSISQLAFSPDGGQVAFVQIVADGPITIQRLDLDGGEPETILTASETVTLTDASDLRWTAKDQLVFFSGPYASDTQGYFLVNSDGSGLERIEAVTPGELEARIIDISKDGRYMIAEGVNETESCGPDYFKASSYVVDLERDEIAQVVCAVYQHNTPGNRAASLFAGTRAIVSSPPMFLPDGSIVAVAERRAEDDSATGLAVVDVDSGRIRIVSNDMVRDSGLWGVSTGLDDGSTHVWVGGYWKEQLTLAPAGG